MTIPALPTTEHLFSYGTLQLEVMQLATFGRKLDGYADQLPGYRLDQLAIQDPAVIATSGKTHHPIVTRSQNPQDSVDGMVFRITAQELQQADSYEVSDYRRDRVQLASGAMAWVYVDARQSKLPG